MSRYISILRGINVSGKKKILMADLKALYEGLGFTNVQTYIQSGNVIFETHKKESDDTIAQNIARAITEKYGFDVPVMVRTATYFEETITTNPFLKEEGINTKKLYVTFLAKLPSAEQLEKLKSFTDLPNQFEIIEKNVFLCCEKYGKTKLSNNFFERKLKTTATTRNWKTVNKLYEMAIK